MKNFLLKNKIYIILSVVAIFILIYLQFFTNTSKNNVTESPSPLPRNDQTQTANLPTPSPQVFTPPPYSQPTLNSVGSVDLGSDKVKVAIVSKEKLKESLPIYIKNFKISNGMSTTLNIYTIPEDPSFLVHVEIYGVDFENQNTSKEDNPNVIAFIESFQEIKRQLTNKGVDIHNIYLIVGQRPYIQATSDLWIKTFGLL